MKKILFSAFSILSLTVSAQTNVYSFGFDDDFPTGWIKNNQSTVGTTPNTGAWFKADYVTPLDNPIFGSGDVDTVPSGQAGGENSFALVNFSSTSSQLTNATISNWLITSAINVKDGDIVSFYTRKGTDGTRDYPDRLEVRYSKAATTVNPSGTTGVGSFTTLGVSVNPNLLTGFVYPKTWTKYSFTISGVGSTVTPVKFGFRYYVTSGGEKGNNSDIIGLDTFSVDRATLAVSDVNKKAMSIYPNPAKDILNITAAQDYKSVKIYNLLGQLVLDKAYEKSINISKLEKGSYILNLTGKDNSTESVKFIKE